MDPSIISEEPNIQQPSESKCIHKGKLYFQQQWDLGMLSLMCDVNIAIAVQRGRHNLERHISVLQLRKAHHKTSITSFFQPSTNLDSGEGPGKHWGTQGQFRVMYDLISEFIWSLYIKPL